MAKVKKAWFVSAETPGAITRLTSIEGKELKLSDLYPIISDDCTNCDLVPLKKGVDMWVDGEGLLKNNWVLNDLASDLYRKAFPHVNPRDLGVAGNAIIIDNTKEGNFLA